MNANHGSNKHNALLGNERVLDIIAETIRAAANGASTFTYYPKRDEPQLIRKLNRALFDALGADAPLLFVGALVCETSAAAIMTRTDKREAFVRALKHDVIDVRADLAKLDVLRNAVRDGADDATLIEARSFVSRLGINFGDIYCYRLVTDSNVYRSPAANAVKTAATRARGSVTFDVAKLIGATKRVASNVERAATKHAADVSKRRADARKRAAEARAEAEAAESKTESTDK